MKAKIKERWVDALRSGQYEQGQGLLRHTTPIGTQFCCLGVLCNLHAQAHPDIAAAQDHLSMYMGMTGSLPFAVMKWAGLPDSDPLIRLGKFRSLISANDGGQTFKQIADAIESQL